MKKLFLALLSMIALCATDVGATTNKTIHWEFTTNLVFVAHPDEIMNVGPVADDFSNDSSQNIGVPLPEDMVKQNWACVREAPTKWGGFKCNNGYVSMYSRVTCETSNSERSVMYIEHVSDGSMLAFVSECKK